MKIASIATALISVAFIAPALAGCSSGTPDRTDAGYKTVSQQMAKNYPGEGWDDLPTARKATDNVCDALNAGTNKADVSRELSKDGIDPVQVIALVGFATDEVCPQKG